MKVPAKVLYYLRATGRPVLASELVHEGEFSSVWKLRTRQGLLILKFSSLAWREGQIIRKIAPLSKDLCPAIVKIWPDCFLLEFIPSASYSRVTDLSPTLVEYAQVQIDSARKVRGLLRAGAAGFELRPFHRKFARWLRATARGELEMDSSRVEFILKKQFGLIKKIASFKVPNAIEHGDLHLGNIIVPASGNAKLIDWSEAAVTHPFLSLAHLFYDTKPIGRSKREKYIAAYLEPWERFEAPCQLRQLLRLVLELAPSYYAYRYAMASPRFASFSRERLLKFSEEQA